MKLRLMTIILGAVLAAGAAFAEDADVMLEKAAQNAGSKAAGLLNTTNLDGLKSVAFMGLTGEKSDVLGAIIEAELNTAQKLKFGVFRDEDRESVAQFREWLYKYGDPTQFPEDIDEKADKIALEWNKNAKIEGLVYGQILGEKADNSKAIVRVILKIVDIRMDNEEKRMRISWHRYLWGEYRSPSVVEMTEQEKRYFRNATEKAIKKALADLAAKPDRIKGLERVVVVPVADDALGIATEAVMVALGKDGALKVVTRDKDEFDYFLEEIRFNTEFGDIASVKIANPPKGLVNIADTILISKVTSRETSPDESRVGLSFRLIKMNNDQIWAGSAEGRYREGAVITFLIIGGAILVGCVALFFVTSGVEKMRRKHETKRKEEKTERKEMRQKAESMSDALRQDESLRNRMVSALAGARQMLKKAQNDSQTAGKSDEAQFVKKSVDGLDNLSRRIENASYGDVALFKAGKISEKELNSLLDFERKMDALIKDVNVEAEAAGAAVASGNYVALLDRLRDLDKRVIELGNRFTDRDRYLREAR